jgi:hypothetical protein
MRIRRRTAMIGAAAAMMAAVLVPGGIAFAHGDNAVVHVPAADTAKPAPADVVDAIPCDVAKPVPGGVAKPVPGRGAEPVQGAVAQPAPGDIVAVPGDVVAVPCDIGGPIPGGVHDAVPCDTAATAGACESGDILAKPATVANGKALSGSSR